MKLSKFKIFYAVCIALIIGYSFYSYFTGTGLSGWLIQLQFAFFGQAIDKLTVFLAIAILMIPLEILRYLLPNVESNENETFDAKTWIKSLSVPKLALLFAAALLPALVGYSIYSYLYAENQEKLKEQIYDVDLNANSLVKIENERYVRLRGKLHEDLSYVVQQGRGSSSQGTLNENYKPLTGENWEESQPVQFIYYSQGYIPPNVTARFGAPQKTVFEGEIINMTLPVYVQSEYEKIGLKLAAPIYIVRSEFFYEGKIPDRFSNSSAHLYLYGGLIISFLGMFILLIWKVQPENKGN